MKRKNELLDSKKTNQEQHQSKPLPPKPQLINQMAHSYSYGQFSDIQTKLEIDHHNHSQQASKSQQKTLETKWVSKVKKSTSVPKLNTNLKLPPNKVSEDNLPASVTENSIEEIKQILPNESLIEPEEIKTIFDSDEKIYTKNHSEDVQQRSKNQTLLPNNRTHITKDGVVCTPLAPPPRTYR